MDTILINCKECGEECNPSDNPYNIPICPTCYPNYKDTFDRIKAYLDENPLKGKTEISTALDIPSAIITLYLDAGSLEYAQLATAELPANTQVKLSQTFIKDETHTRTDINNVHIIEHQFSAFIMLGDDYSIQTSEKLPLENLQLGARARLLNARINPASSEVLKRLLYDGNKFIIYFENDELIIPAECLYLKDRPAQISLMPNKIRLKKERAKRVRVNKNAIAEFAGRSYSIAIYDLSRTGISFFANSNIANPQNIVKVKDKNVVILSRQKLTSKYFYRGYFQIEEPAD